MFCSRLLMASAWALCACGGVGGGASAAWASPEPSCPTTVRVTSFDPGDAPASTDDWGVRRLLEALAVAVLKRAELEPHVQVGPFARVVRDMEIGEADVTVLSDRAFDGSTGLVLSIPMARVQIAAYRLAANHKPEAPPPADTLGAVYGVPLPANAAVPTQVTRVTTYTALVQMLERGRVEQILAFRPTIDMQLLRHAALQGKLGPPQVLDEHRTSFHISTRLPKPCQRRLADAARAVQREELRGIFQSRLPGIDIRPFLLP